MTTVRNLKFLELGSLQRQETSVPTPRVGLWTVWVVSVGWVVSGRNLGKAEAKARRERLEKKRNTETASRQNPSH